MHVNSGYRARGDRARAALRAGLRGAEAVVSPSSSCVGMVREVYPELAREAGTPARPAARRALRRASSSSPSSSSTRLGVTDVGASFPTGSPTTRPAIRCGSRGSATAPLRLLGAVAGLELVELPDAAECCGFGGTFAVKNADTSSAMADRQVRGDRLDAAPRSARRSTARACCRSAAALARSAPGAGACTWPRSCRARSGRETSLEQRSFPAAAARGARRRAAARQHGQRDRRRSATSARGSSPSCPTGRSCARPAARSRPTCSRNLDRYLVQFEESVTRAGGHVHWARDAAEANAIVLEIARRARRRARSSRSSRSRPTRSA